MRLKTTANCKIFLVHGYTLPGKGFEVNTFNTTFDNLGWQDLPSIEVNTFNTFPAYRRMGAQMSIYTFLKSKKAFSGKNSSKSKGAIIEILPPLFFPAPG